MTFPRVERVLAFTLIELLVVVAIIALLISILLPALHGARAQAKQTQCLTNFSNMGKAGMVYAHENKDTVVQSDPVTQADIRRYGDVHFVACLLPGLGQPEDVDNLFNRSATGGTNAEAMHYVCQRTKPFQCPTFPEELQSLDYVVSAFIIPQRLSNQTISPTPGTGPASAAATIPRSIFFKFGKQGRADHSKLLYLTEAHEKMPLPPPPGAPWNPAVGWGELIDVFIPNHISFGQFPRVANDQRHPRGIGAAFFDGHAEILPLKRMDPGHPSNIYDRCRLYTYDENEPR